MAIDPRFLRSEERSRRQQLGRVSLIWAYVSFSVSIHILITRHYFQSSHIEQHIVSKISGKFFFWLDLYMLTI